MSRYKPEPTVNDPSILQKPRAIGILLVNLGTPDDTSPKAVRRYLAEFLSDPRVIAAPAWLWQPILHGFILRTRPKKSARAYQKIWLAEGSPLLVYSQRLAVALQTSIPGQPSHPVFVKLAMRYGRPNIATALDEFKHENVQRVLVVPLYPQYSATTTASTMDALAQYLQRVRVIPEIRVVADYHDNAQYIAAVAKSIRAHWDKHPRGERLLLSFHGLPQEYVTQGDPYQQQCVHSAHLIAAKLGLEQNQWEYSFQSRFGPKAWIKPYTETTLETWAKSGVRSVDIACPGFPVDCLETLEEIAMQDRELFIANGGETLNYIPALNDSALQINFLHELIKQKCADWFSAP